jgi:predicted nucleic acid-binding protein
VFETYTLLRMKRGYSAAWRFVEATAASLRLSLLDLDAVQVAATWEMLRRYADHHWSFVDGNSFVSMKANRIRHAFAFDDDFATAGFALV